MPRLLYRPNCNRNHNRNSNSNSSKPHRGTTTAVLKKKMTNSSSATPRPGRVYCAVVNSRRWTSSGDTIKNQTCIRLAFIPLRCMRAVSCRAYRSDDFLFFVFSPLSSLFAVDGSWVYRYRTWALVDNNDNDNDNYYRKTYGIPTCAV